MNLTPPDETAVIRYYDQPALKQPVWIWTVPVYFYVGGVAGAALVLGAVAQFQHDDELQSLVRISRATGLGGQVLGSVFLIVDLGRPERFFNMLRVLNPLSPLSVGSWVLAVGGASAAASVFLPERSANIAGMAAGLLAIPLAGYTGVLLANTAIPVWRGARRSLPVLFVASAIASCASIFELMKLPARAERVVRTYGVIGKAAELASMHAVERELAPGPELSRSLHSGIAGTLWTASKVLTVASLVVTLAPGALRAKRIAGVLGTVAGVGLRFGVFYAGVRSSREPGAGL